MNPEIIAHIQSIYEHWVEVTRSLREVDTLAASNLTVATVLMELAGTAPEQEAPTPPVNVSITPPSVTVNGKAMDLSEWTPQIETTVRPS